MGNTIGIGKTKNARVMKIDGQTEKHKTPIRAYDIVKNHPGHVLIESSSVKRFGIRAKPLEPQQNLQANKIYFLIELPKLPQDHYHRCNRHRALKRTKSAIVHNHMPAQERLERLMLSRGRSLCERVESGKEFVSSDMIPRSSDGPVRVKMRIPRAHVVKLVEESKDGVEVADKIIDLYMEHDTGGGDRGFRRVLPEVSDGLWLDYQRVARRPNLRSVECGM